MASLSAVERCCYGVYPITGKFPNVRDVSDKKIEKYAEIQNIMKILGLELGKTYDDVKSLRYGQLMIMTDPVDTIRRIINHLMILSENYSNS